MFLHYLLFLLKKLRFSYILQDFLLGIVIRMWAVDNFSFSQHVSVLFLKVPWVSKEAKKIKELKFAVKNANISLNISND